MAAQMEAALLVAAQMEAALLVAAQGHRWRQIGRSELWAFLTSLALLPSLDIWYFSRFSCT